MAPTPFSPLLRYLRNRLGSAEAGAATDEQLLRRFAGGQEEGAFEALLRRHGPLVWGVCRRVLANEQDAEDAFQATFLVLVCKALSIRKQTSVASWLHGVAHRIALKARAEAARRRREFQGVPLVQEDTLSEVSWREVRAMLDDEVLQLPERLRVPFTLCCLEGQSKAEAARQLGWKEGTVSSRLDRARQRLRGRLARRGIVHPVGSLAAMLAANALPAVVPVPVLEATVKAAALVTAGKAVTVGTSSTTVAGLVRGALLQTLYVTKLKTGAALLLAVTLLAAGVGLAARQTLTQGVPTPTPGAESDSIPQTAGPLESMNERLPDGASARLGTAHLRACCGSLHFSADGQTLVGIDGGRLVRVWDAASGNLLETRRLSGRPLRTQWELQTARSRDGNTLLIGEGSSLEMWDIPSGKRVEVLLPRDRKRLGPLILSDDRRLLFLGETVRSELVPNGGGFGRLEQQQNLLLWDTATGKPRLLTEDEASLVALAVSPDGKRLASSSYGKGTRVWDAETGALLWQDPKYNAEEVAFTPDSQALIAGPGGGQSSWHVWDAASGEPAQQYQPPTVGYAWMFAVSPDGSKLLIPTVQDYVLWDLQSGKVLHRWPGANQAGRGLFASDSRSVVTYDTTLRRWDVATGEPLYGDVSALGHTAPVRRLFFTPDGRQLASVGEDRTLRIWDVAGAKLLHTTGLGTASPDDWDMNSDGGTTNRDGWTLSPDGSTLVGVDNRLTVHRWSVAEGRPLETYELGAAKELDIRLRALHVRVAQDGKTLAVAAWPQCPEYAFNKYCFSFWDLKTGRLLRWGGDPGRDYRGDFASLSPDGRFAARDGKLFNTLTGESLTVEGPGEEGVGYVFSSDGRLLASNGGKGVCVREVATGQLLIELPEDKSNHAAFAPDGRRLVCTRWDRLVVWDLQTGKAVLERLAPESLLRSGAWTSAGVAYAPDGRTIATGHPDGTVLLWNAPDEARLGRPLTELDLATVWDDLGAFDSAKAYAAVWRCWEDPEGAVRFLTKQFPAVELPSADEWRALIRGMDSDQFDEREAASHRLEALGRTAEAPLRQALKDNPTPEQKRRIEALLSALEPSDRPRGKDLRAVRAVAILEQVNTPAARKVLETWAKRSPGTWLAEEAARGGTPSVAPGRSALNGFAISLWTIPETRGIVCASRSCPAGVRIRKPRTPRQT
jgi:RNA polymerase sigma factor (sigma-70 family)